MIDGPTVAKAVAEAIQEGCDYGCVCDVEVRAIVIEQGDDGEPLITPRLAHDYYCPLMRSLLERPVMGGMVR